MALINLEMIDGATGGGEFSPVRAVFPPKTDPNSPLDRLWPAVEFQYQTIGAPPPAGGNKGLISLGNDPGGPRAVWSFGQEQSHIPFAFDADPQGLAFNVAARLHANDKTVGFINGAFVSFNNPPKTVKYLAYAGFAKGKGANAATFNTDAVLINLNTFVAQVISVSPTTVTHPIGGVPQPMGKIELTFDATSILPGNYWLGILTTIEGGKVSPDQPPALFGARLIQTQ